MLDCVSLCLLASVAAQAAAAVSVVQPACTLGTYDVVRTGLQVSSANSVVAVHDPGVMCLMQCVHNTIDFSESTDGLVVSPVARTTYPECAGRKLQGLALTLVVHAAFQGEIVACAQLPIKFIKNLKSSDHAHTFRNASGSVEIYAPGLLGGCGTIGDVLYDQSGPFLSNLALVSIFQPYITGNQ